MSRFSKFSSGLLLSVFLCFGAWAENPDHVDQLRATLSCADCDLAGAILDGEDLSAAVLTGATFYMSGLNGSNFSGADLTGANLGGAQLQGTNFSGANLTAADLTRTDLSAADLTGAILVDAVTDENTICPDASSGPCSF